MSSGHRLLWLAGLALMAGGCASARSEPFAAPPPQVTPLAAPLRPTAGGATADVWRPPPGVTWQWQLSGTPIDLSVKAEVFDIDLFDNDAATVAALHAKGRKVICYITVGSREDWRPDAEQFPASVLGKELPGWPGERWLDIRRLDVLGPILRSRLDLCRDKGFEGVEPDNIDGFANDTGFPLTASDQLAFNRWLAKEAHGRGLSIGLKNDPDQVGQLLPDYDWALTEDCFAQGWCDQMRPFIDAGKAVFTAEYTDTGITLNQFCPKARDSRFSGILKERDLGAWREACP